MAVLDRLHCTSVAFCTFVLILTGLSYTNSACTVSNLKYAGNCGGFIVISVSSDLYLTLGGSPGATCESPCGGRGLTLCDAGCLGGGCGGSAGGVSCGCATGTAAREDR